MIVRRGFYPWRIVRLSAPRFGLLLLYNSLITVLVLVGGLSWLSLPDLPLPLLGSAVALVVTLRNNAAYARWWEGRGLWGAVVNNSRSFARSLALFLPDVALRETLVRLQVAYVAALRCHLLRLEPWGVIDGMVSAEVLAGLRDRANVPVAIQGEIVTRLAQAGLDSMALGGIDKALGGLADAQGGLERIKNTPMPRRYNQFPMLFAWAYCVLLPLGLVSSLGPATSIAASVIGFMFLALDRMGVDLEDPFEGTVNDIPMLALARTIEIDLLQGIGVAAPGPVLPEDGVLW